MYDSSLVARLQGCWEGIHRDGDTRGKMDFGKLVVTVKHLHITLCIFIIFLMIECPDDIIGNFLLRKGQIKVIGYFQLRMHKTISNLS